MGVCVLREDYEWVYIEELYVIRRKEIMGRFFFLIFKMNFGIYCFGGFFVFEMYFVYS